MSYRLNGGLDRELLISARGVRDPSSTFKFIFLLFNFFFSF